MPAYSFEALSANGETRKGTIDADSAKAARSLLRTQSLVPMVVVAVSATAADKADTNMTRWKEIVIKILCLG